MRNTDPKPKSVPTPKQIITHLDRFVCGQERAKRDLAVAGYNHYLSLAHRLDAGPGFEDFGKQHILVFGPTGTGKTYLVRKLAKFLGVPVAFASATSLVESGYVGDQVEAVVRNLLAAANYDPFLAERGIVFLDEIDKIRRTSGHGRDVSGEGVQNGLLTLLDGRVVTVKHDAATHHVDTSRIWFVCAGAFTGLADIVRARLGKTEQQIGFAASDVSESVGGDFTALLQVELEDMQTFGFIPEFMGRFSTFSPLHPLRSDDLRRILTESEDSILKKQQLLFELHGVTLTVEPSAIGAIAELAEKLGTGARGLTRCIFRCLDDVDWRLPDLAAEGVTRVVLHESCIREGAPPKMQRAEPKDAHAAEILRENALQPDLLQNLERRLTVNHRACDAVRSEHEVRAEIQRLKVQVLDLENASSTAKAWLAKVEAETDARSFLQLLEQLESRGSTWTEFYLAFLYAGTSDAEAILHYLDYTRRKDGSRSD